MSAPANCWNSSLGHDHDVVIIISIMMPMTIRITRVKAMNSMIMPGGMPPDGHAMPAGTGTGTMVHFTVPVHVPGLNGRATIDMAFRAPAGSSREEWEEIAYERALMMLDPV